MRGLEKNTHFDIFSFDSRGSFLSYRMRVLSTTALIKWGMQIPAGLVSTTAASYRIIFMITLWFKDFHLEMFVLIL